MNRREYLRALVAFGASSSLPAFAEGGPHRAAGIAEQRVAEKVFTTQSGTIGPPCKRTVDRFPVKSTGQKYRVRFPYAPRVKAIGAANRRHNLGRNCGPTPSSDIMISHN